MAPKPNIVHDEPPLEDLVKVRKQGHDAIPLVKKAVTKDGREYYPVFLPFHARVICPWCFKVGRSSQVIFVFTVTLTHSF